MTDTREQEPVKVGSDDRRQPGGSDAFLPVVSTKTDPINPAHYRGDTIMRIIEDFALGFCLGNVVKYVLRHGVKAGLEDLKKARWYLDREIQTREATK